MTQSVPGRARRCSTAASRLLLACLLGAATLAASGCVGGASERPPKSSVAAKKNHWVFPLYSYSRNEGRKTIRPLFLFPISYGGNSEVASSNQLDDDRLAGGEAPQWKDRSTAGGPRQPETVQPGVWDSSLPQGGSPLYVDGATAGGGREHEVRAGDTLYAISKRYYGTGAEWSKIAEANRDRVASPSALSIGTRLRIP